MPQAQLWNDTQSSDEVGTRLVEELQCMRRSDNGHDDQVKLPSDAFVQLLESFQAHLLGFQIEIGAQVINAMLGDGGATHVRFESIFDQPIVGW